MTTANKLLRNDRQAVAIRVVAWVKSDAGKKALAEARNSAHKEVQNLKQKSRLDLEILNQPVTI